MGLASAMGRRKDNKRCWKGEQRWGSGKKLAVRGGGRARYGNEPRMGRDFRFFWALGVTHLGVGLASCAGCGGCGTWNFSVCEDFWKGGVRGGFGFSGGAVEILERRSEEMDRWKGVEEGVGEGGALGGDGVGDGGGRGGGAGGVGGEKLGGVARGGGGGWTGGGGVGGGDSGGGFLPGGFGFGVVEGDRESMVGLGDLFWCGDFWCGSFHQASAGTRAGGRLGGRLSGLGTIGAMGRNRASLETSWVDFDWTYFGTSGFESADVGGSGRFTCGLGGGSALGGECLACGSSVGGWMVGAFVRGGAFASSSPVGGGFFPLGASDSCKFGLRRFGVLFFRWGDRPGRGFD